MSIIISNMNVPPGCQKCKFFRKHLFGNGLDYTYFCILGAKDFPMPWIRQMEERASDCPINPLEQESASWCTDCKEYDQDEHCCHRFSKVIRDTVEEMKQEPKTGHCKDCKWWKDSDGAYRRGIGAESQCLINRREVLEGNGYCYMFEPRESEVKNDLYTR